MITIPNLNNNNTYKGKQLKYHSFFSTSPRLFNCLPRDLRDASFNMTTLKMKVDEFLHDVPDQPRVVGYTNLSFTKSNSITEQICYHNV